MPFDPCPFMNRFCSQLVDAYRRRDECSGTAGSIEAEREISQLYLRMRTHRDGCLICGRKSPQAVTRAKIA